MKIMNIKPVEFDGFRTTVIAETECKITKVAVKSSATNIIPSGNVVIATRVGLGKVCLLGQDTAINQDLHGIIPIDPKVLSTRFLFWWLKSIANLIVAEGTDATVQGVKLKNARALFESHLQSVFADLATDITDGDHLPPRPYFDALKPYKKPRQGDVLYTVTGSFGIPVIVNDDAEFCFQRHIGLIRPKPDTSSSWLYYLLLSPQLIKQANDGATGTAQKTVSLKILRSFEVPKVTPK